MGTESDTVLAAAANGAATRRGMAARWRRGRQEAGRGGGDGGDSGDGGNTVARATMAAAEAATDEGLGAEEQRRSVGGSPCGSARRRLWGTWQLRGTYRGDERRAQSSSLATTMAATVVCHRRRQRWRRRQRHWRQRRPCPSVECCADACLRTRGEGARMEGKAGVRDRRRVAHTCRINQAGGRWAGGALCARG